MPFAVGQTLEVTIEKLSMGGDGIARARSGDAVGSPEFVLFVPYSALGDRLEVRITERKKTFARAEILRVLNEGKERTSPRCPFYYSPARPNACGGCNFQHLSYGAQVLQKVSSLRESLQRIA